MQAAAPDPMEFRRTMGLFATGVTVVTVEAGGEMHGMTANAVLSVSLEPLLVCVSVGRTACMHAFLRQSRGYALNILSEDQQALSQFFAGSWPHERPPEYRLESWTGGPRLVGCVAAVAGEIERVLDGGDHEIFVARVLALYRPDGPPRNPLLFFGGRYYGLRGPAAPPRDPIEVWHPEEVRIFYES
jgi:flavin reductase